MTEIENDFKICNNISLDDLINTKKTTTTELTDYV